MFFIAGGSHYFSMPKGTKNADKMDTQRKLCNGRYDLTPAQKQSFNPLNIDGLVEFFETMVPENRIADIRNTFGIPDELSDDHKLLFRAMAYQFKAFLDSETPEADDIIAMEYQHLLINGDIPSEIPIEKKYHDDDVLISQNQISVHQIASHDRNVPHEWIIQNRGNREWRGRRLYFLNHADVKPRAVSNYVDIPDTPPGEYIKVATSMDARRHEGTTICHWIMIDEQGDDCFPNSNTFDFTLIADFIYVPKNTEV